VEKQEREGARVDSSASFLLARFQKISPLDQSTSVASPFSLRSRHARLLSSL
jgi:hypothetical protein